MKKLPIALLVLFTAVLVSYVSYVCNSIVIIPAHANEKDAQAVGSEALFGQEESSFAEVTAAESSQDTYLPQEQENETISELPNELISEQPPEHNSEEEFAPPEGELPAEQPYWVSEVTYANLMEEYHALAGMADGNWVVLGATLTINSINSGLQSAINLGEAATILSNGMNAPSYNDGTAALLTAQEGYPQSGTISDRSVLKLIESGEAAVGDTEGEGDSRVYEATFFFGSDRYPEAPFTAFRTYVVIESDETSHTTEPQTGEENTISPPRNNASDGAAGDPTPGEIANEEGGSEQDLALARSIPEYEGGLAYNPRLLGPQGFAISLFANGKATALPVGSTAGGTLNFADSWNQSMTNGRFRGNITWQGYTFDTTLACLDPFFFGPEQLDGLYTNCSLSGTVSWIDPYAGLSYVNFFIPAPRAGYQRLAANNVPIPTEFLGSISLVKSSASPSITEGNACYDLAGAEYGLYRTWADADADASRVHTFITDSAGNSMPVYDIPYGDYVIRELVAPLGYELDPSAYPVSLYQTHVTVERVDVPYKDPVSMIVRKLDTVTGEAYGVDDPNGLLLAGAEFTVRYWDGYYGTIEEAEAAGDPARTWVFATQQNGVVQFRDSFLVSGDVLFVDRYGDATIPLGTVAIQETKAPPGYLLPAPSPVSVQQIKETGDPLLPVTRLNAIIIEEEPHIVTVEKVDTNTNEPVPNTEFTLYKESSLGIGDWTPISSHITDGFGKCVFTPVAVGSYKLDETRSNPNYAELEESGDSAHYFTITPESTEEAQVFHNDLIQVAIEVYKKTIPLTNTALDGTSDEYGKIVGSEEYLYRFGARSNSNVRVDEFVITDSLEYVTSLGYRMTTLWTGTAPEGMDYDGLMHVLYKTNMTHPQETVSFAYDPMSANPANPNNPNNNMSVSIEPGWRVWQECISTTTAIRLDVADLGLKEGEYITGVRAVYGGVVKGFYTGVGWQNEETEELGALALDESTFAPFELRDWYYSVVASDALRTMDEMGNETVMRGSIQADLFRNWGDKEPVLTDLDNDQVETRVIETFKYNREDLGINPSWFGGSFFGLPRTGDTLWVSVLLLALPLAVGACFICVGLHHRKKKRSQKH